MLSLKELVLNKTSQVKGHGSTPTDSKLTLKFSSVSLLQTAQAFVSVRILLSYSERVKLEVSQK